MASIDSSNIGFKLLKKCGWKEGTGLGADEQGRLEPIQTRVKHNKRGLGADEPKPKVKVQAQVQKDHHPKPKDLDLPSKKRRKSLTKHLRKLQEEEKRIQETEFDRAFFREFWPENV